MTSSIRADLTYGTAYGLAASAVFWSLQLEPPVANANDLLLVVLAAAAGAAATTTRGRWRLRPTYAVILAALLLSGPFVSCAAGWACVLGRSVGRGPFRAAASRRRATRLGLRLSRVTLASAGGALVFGLSGGPFGNPAAGSALVVPVILHALVYATTRCILVDLTFLGIGRRARIGTLLRRLAGALSGCIAATAVGWAAAALLARPDLRLPAAGLTLLAVWAVHRLHGERHTAESRQASSMVELRRAVTRALARLMEARDPSTQDHVRRVHRLCIGVGKSLDMSETSLETLAAAALLHDIGKVSVPESILNKPGTLTPAEMDRVKRHPIVGAEIVQALPFRHALAPLVRHHHERWDGKGYPDGLAGERIPLGARILATVDCYDALTSDRPYRKALDHREAAAFLEREAGAMFDSDVVDALLDYLEARRPASAAGPTVEAEQAVEPRPVEEPAPSGSLALAQQELETLYDISRAMGYGLNLEEFLTLVGCRLSSLVPFQSLVIYFADHDAELLRAHFAMGCAAEKLRLMTVPIGERLSGWAALEQRAVIGRDHVSPVDRDGSRSDLEEWESDPVVSKLGASLAAPMVAEGGLVGVLTLYDAIDRGFTTEDKRILARIAGYVAQVATLENGDSFVRQSSLTDPLTGVPNARFLWLECAHRIAQPEDGFGLLAFRIGGLTRDGDGQGIDGLLCQVARLFASACRTNETLVRFGHDMFVILTSIRASGDLVRRWHELATEVEQPLVDRSSGEVHQVRLTAAHAAFPDDGTSLDVLLETLDRRMTLSARRGRTVLPFRAPQPASSGSEYPR